MQQQQFNGSDSLEALVSISSSKEERRSRRSSGGGGGGYSEEFQAMLDSLESEDCAGETGTGPARKRRLSTEQVRGLERYFELDNKLEPDRKAKLAAELGLQPRQVAIWFQNRRARRRTKQLEKDFRLLKADYDSLNLDFGALQQENKSLSQELDELKKKLRLVPDSACDGGFRGNGSPESDSNGVLANDVVYNSQLHVLSMSPPPEMGFLNFAGQQEAVADWFQLPDMMLVPAAEHRIVKMEEEVLFNSGEFCNVYSVDQSPALHWHFLG